MRASLVRDYEPTGLVALQNLQVTVQLAPNSWPVLRRLQQHMQQQGSATSSHPAAQLLAVLAPGASTTRGLAVELTVTPAPHNAASAAVAVPVHFCGPTLPDTAAVQLCGELEVAASRAPTVSGLANFLAARLCCYADGSGALVLQGVTVTPAPILDIKPLLSKRVAAHQLANRLQDLLRCPPPGNMAVADAAQECEASVPFRNPSVSAMSA